MASGRSNAWRGGRDRQTLNTFDFKVFHNCPADGEPSSMKMPSKSWSITLQVEGCFLKAKALYMSVCIYIYLNIHY